MDIQILLTILCNNRIKYYLRLLSLPCPLQKLGLAVGSSIFGFKKLLRHGSSVGHSLDNTIEEAIKPLQLE